MPSIEQEVQCALARGEFVPYFQPLVEIRTGVIEGFEVLARWDHPTRGIVTPDHFIPTMMEQRGLINALTMSLLRHTFIAAKLVPDHIGFAVNVSPTQLHDRSLPQLMDCMAREANFDLRRLTVEITESALLHDLKLAGEVAADLKAHGIRLALDDFGTGYSSLLHLQALPFDELKVDMSFVRTMVQSRQSRKITSAVVGLGQSLGLRTVAEGVEELTQAEMLLWQGCNLGQGWLYERAVPAGQLPEVMAMRLPVVDTGATALSEAADVGHAVDARPIDRMSQLRAIYDGAPVGLAFIDRDLRYVSLNKRLAEMHGVPIEQHLGRKVEEVAPEFFCRKEFYLRRALMGQAILNVEMPKPGSLQSHGEEGTLQVSYQPARDEAGEVLGISISVADISALKENENALERSERRLQRDERKLQENEAQLQAIFQAVPIGLVLAEASSGAVVSANPHAVGIFGSGLRPGALWGDVIRSACEEENVPVDSDTTALLRAMEKGEVIADLEILHRKSSGQMVWLSVSATPIYDEDGAINGGVIAIQEMEKPRPGRVRAIDVSGQLEALPQTQPPNGSGVAVQLRA